jgi:hypothetical protein
MDGTVTTLTQGPWSEYDVVPSPDGSLLAEVRYVDLECLQSPPQNGTIPCEIRLRLLHASTLIPASTDTAVFMLGRDTASSTAFRGKPVAVWSPEGDLYLTNDHESVRKTPGQPLAWQGPRACKYPSTRSSQVSPSREMVTWESGVLEIVTDTVFTVFGCLPREG